MTDNVFGDITMDLAGAVGGGIGMAASANLNPSGSFPSMFEPVHGSAPDIAGLGIADPTAAIMSAALMMDFLGYSSIANQMSGAARNVLSLRSSEKLQLSTSEIGAEIRNALSRDS